MSKASAHECKFTKHTHQSTPSINFEVWFRECYHKFVSEGADDCRYIAIQAGWENGLWALCLL
jgi:hypothetical protein